MKGTEKQIKWANEIKARFAMSESKLMAALEFASEEQMAKIEAAIPELGESPIATLVEKYNSIADAKEEASWWIEHRRHSDIGGRMLTTTADKLIINELIENL